MSRPKTVFEHYPDPKNSPLGPQKSKIGAKIKSKSYVRIAKKKKTKQKSKVRIEGTIENKSFSST